MAKRICAGLLSLTMIQVSVAQAAELTGRFSMLGVTAKAEEGDITNVGSDSLTADQQSLRLMLENAEEQSEWSVHLKTLRSHVSGYPSDERHASELFRYRELSGDWLDEGDERSATRIGYELDRAVYKHRFGPMTLSVGRQPLDWGSGRFWQPLNVFGAFAPTDLDTDFKSGIDAAIFDWYPSAFSSLTAAYVLSPEDDATIDDSGAVYYRRQVGEQSELSVLVGRVIGNTVIGGAFESAWAGMGWRVEGVNYRLEEIDENSVFWIAGIDYQFEEGTVLVAEWYDNSHGASTEASLASLQNDRMTAYRLQQHVGRRVLGVGVERDITPLLHGGYTLLASALEDEDNQLATSFMHQLNVIYSVSNESDLLFSLLFANGKGLTPQGEPQSEFGHLPASMTLRLRFYF